MGNEIAIPYSGHIAGGIQDGTDVIISGRVLQHHKQFSINLCMGRTYDQGCALHFNPRLDEQCVVRNHMQNGSWGTEERAGNMPFHKNMGFEVHMKVHNFGYKVSVNNRHFCDFNHRLPKELVQYIYIEGQVHINYINFRGGHGAPSYPTGPNYPPAVPGYPPAGSAPGYPSSTPHYPPAPSFPSAPPYPGGPAGMGGGPIYNPPMPFKTSLPFMMMPGKIIFISGIPHPSPSRFTVNLRCGMSDYEDLALHFDARFNFGNDRNQVVRTHCTGGSNFGPEEKQITHFPFYPSAAFEMMILAEHSSFKIAVNNQHFTEFFYRIQPVQRVTVVEVVGDVSLTQVRFQ